MDKSKLNKFGIIIFIISIAIFAILSGYIFFNNSTNLAINIRSNNEQIKRDIVINEALTKLVVNKNDSIISLMKKIDKISIKKKNDSVSLTKKDDEIKRLEIEKDSLIKVIYNYKWSDIEPINTHPNR